MASRQSPSPSKCRAVWADFAPSDSTIFEYAGNFRRSVAGTFIAGWSFYERGGVDAAAVLIPYAVNVPLWSDAAIKTRWLAAAK